MHSPFKNFQEEEELDEESDVTKSGPDYDYLLGMTMWTLTLEKKNELLKKRDEKIHELKTLQAKSPAQIWREDLDEFLAKVSFVNFRSRNDFPFAQLIQRNFFFFLVG